MVAVNLRPERAALKHGNITGAKSSVHLYRSSAGSAHKQDRRMRSSASSRTSGKLPLGCSSGTSTDMSRAIDDRRLHVAFTAVNTCHLQWSARATAKFRPSYVELARLGPALGLGRAREASVSAGSALIRSCSWT